MQLNDAVQYFLEGYFSTCRRSQKTQAAYKLDLAQFVAHVGASTLLAAVEPASLEAWAKAMIDDCYAPVSVRRKFAALRVFFAYWIRRGRIETSPLWRIRLDLNTERKLPRSISATDAEQLLSRAWAAVDHIPQPGSKANSLDFLAFRNVTAVELLFATGLRVGELVALDTCAVDPKAETTS